MLRLPSLAGGVQLVHDLQSEGRGAGVGVALAGHVLHALIQSRVAQGDGGVSAVQQLVDGLALLQPRAGAVLPQDGCRVGQRTLQALVAAQQRPVTQLHALVEDAPEFLDIPAGAQGDVRQVHGHDALVEPPVVLGVPILVHIGGQEAAAAHAGIAVAVAVLVHLQLQHLLGDVVGHHPLGGALGGQLRQLPVFAAFADVVLLQHIDELGERRRDPHALFVLHALVPLQQRLLDDQGQVVLFLLVLGLAQIHEHRHEGGLSVGGQQRDHLILYGLHAAADLLPQPLFRDGVDLVLGDSYAHGVELVPHAGADLFPADLHEGGQMSQRDGLSAVLVAGYLRHDLGGDVAGGGEAVGLLDQRSGDDGAVLQHILQIDQVAVVHMLGVIIRVMEVDDALIVGLHDVLGQQNAVGDVPADFAGHIVPLGRVHHRVLVGVLLLGLLVVALDEAEDLVVGGIGLTHQRTGVAVGDIVLGHLESAVGHDIVLHHILYLLHGRCAVHLLALQVHGLRDALDLHRRHPIYFLHGLVGLGDGDNDLGDVEAHLGAVSLDDLHGTSSYLIYLSLPSRRHTALSLHPQRCVC